jgi:glycerol-3-phosphate acyltransferase PlsY
MVHFNVMAQVSGFGAWLIYFFPIVCYFLGGIPFGFLTGKLKGVDIRQHGSGNIGATNAGRVLGKPYGILAFVLDLAKGLLPVLLMGMLIPRTPGVTGGIAYLLWILAAAGCIIGHVFPVYLGFKGGKGVATSLGAVLGIYPYLTVPGLIAFGIWIILTAVTRYVSVGSVGAACAFPITFVLLVIWRSSGEGEWPRAADLWPLYVFSFLLAGLVVYRHRSNLQRLWAGTESKIGASTRSSG